MTESMLSVRTSSKRGLLQYEAAMKPKLSRIFTSGKTLILAYDQGLEHGPTDFNDKNVDPQYIIDIAKKGKFNALAVQKGIAEKYPVGKVPLILKLNGKTRLVKGEPYSPILCTVNEAVKLGASAVGYTIYIGSAYEAKMFSDFEQIEREAHNKGLPVIVWMYPRGKSIKNELSRETLAYAARVSLELGADIVKMKYNGNPNDLRWIIKSAGKTKVVIAGGTKVDPSKFLKEVSDVMKSGAAGLAIGRNVWQHPTPLKMAQALKAIISQNKTPAQAIKFLQ